MPGRWGSAVARIFADSRVRYLAVGGGTAVVEFATFTAFLGLGLPPAAANALSFCIAVVVNFTGYRLWSFAGDHGLRGRTQFVAYVLLALANVAITTAIIHRLDELGVPAWIAKLGCMVMVTIWNYLLLNHVIFRRQAPEPDDGQRPESA